MVLLGITRCEFAGLHAFFSCLTSAVHVDCLVQPLFLAKPTTIALNLDGWQASAKDWLVVVALTAPDVLTRRASCDLGHLAGNQRLAVLGPALSFALSQARSGSSLAMARRASFASLTLSERRILCLTAEI